MAFLFTSCPISDLILISPQISDDDRGFFLEVFKDSDFKKNGIDVSFVQDNHSGSARGTLRGLHFQTPPFAQAKLVRCTRGRLWNVAVDLRSKSQTYKQWFGVEISEFNRLMLFIPIGFAHGFVALEDGAELQYKCSAEYNKSSEGGIRWDDPDISIDWPLTEVIMSIKDMALPRLKDISCVF